MSLSPAYDLALNDMLAAYAKGDEPSKNDASVKLVKAAASVKVTRAPKVKAPASNGATSVVVTKTAPTLDAPAYMVALREAGYRVDATGKRFFDHNSQRDDLIKAIDAYIGYDSRKDFASQELNARSQAAREIRKARGELFHGPDRHEIRMAQASLSGYVAGMPDNRTKDLANLEARERLAVNTLIEQEHLAMTATTDQEKGKALAMAQVERERLISIRRDLATHGK